VRGLSFLLVFVGPAGGGSLTLMDFFLPLSYFLHYVSRKVLSNGRMVNLCFVILSPTRGGLWLLLITKYVQCVTSSHT
jgi:hypothetical protein